MVCFLFSSICILFPKVSAPALFSTVRIQLSEASCAAKQLLYRKAETVFEIWFFLKLHTITTSTTTNHSPGTQVPDQSPSSLTHFISWNDFSALQGSFFCVKIPVCGNCPLWYGIMVWASRFPFQGSATALSGAGVLWLATFVYTLRGKM